jgi:hypothetical protein
MPTLEEGLLTVAIAHHARQALAAIMDVLTLRQRKMLQQIEKRFVERGVSPKQAHEQARERAQRMMLDRLYPLPRGSFFRRPPIER